MLQKHCSDFDGEVQSLINQDQSPMYGRMEIALVNVFVRSIPSHQNLRIRTKNKFTSYRIPELTLPLLRHP